MAPDGVPAVQRDARAGGDLLAGGDLYQGADAGFFPAVARWLAGLPLIPNMFAAGALGLELLAPLILAIRRTRPFYILAAIGMHGSIALFLGLDYSAWLAVGFDYSAWLAVVAVAVPWDRIGARAASLPPGAGVQVTTGR